MNWLLRYRTPPSIRCVLPHTHAYKPPVVSLKGFSEFVGIQRGPFLFHRDCLLHWNHSPLDFDAVDNISTLSIIPQRGRKRKRIRHKNRKIFSY